VIARYHLDALSERETGQYIRHRLGVAGLKGAVPFERAAIRRVHQLTRGVPRRINLLCDRALLGAYAIGRPAIDRRVVDQAAKEVTGYSGRRLRWRMARRWRIAAVAAAGVIAGAILFALATHALDRLLSQSPATANTTGRN
jgi:general secretion pathway protein A